MTDFLKPAVAVVRKNSKMSTLVLAYTLFFLMLPIDSLLGVSVQSQVKSTLSKLLMGDIMKVVLAVLFLVIWSTGDVMLLLLLLALLKKLGMY